MIYREEKKDLFLVDFNEWTPAHCISLDCKMGAGIAVPMKEEFKLHDLSTIILNSNIPIKVGDAVYHNKVYNLITKKNYWDKPTMKSLRETLMFMCIHSKKHDIRKIVTPRIGSGLDKLSWFYVRSTIVSIFAVTDMEIMVCYI